MRIQLHLRIRQNGLALSLLLLGSVSVQNINGQKQPPDQVGETNTVNENLKALRNISKSDALDLLLITSTTGAAQFLTAEDADAIDSTCKPSVVHACFVVHAFTKISNGAKGWYSGSTYGTTPAFLKARQWPDLQVGKPFTDNDVREGKRVCLLGQTVVKELFGTESPLGKEVGINKQAFKAVGVLGKRGEGLLGLDEDDVVLVPWTTVKKTDTLIIRDHHIVVRVKSATDAPAAIQKITALLRERHKAKLGATDEFVIRDLMAIAKELKLTK